MFDGSTRYGVPLPWWRTFGVGEGERVPWAMWGSILEPTGLIVDLLAWFAVVWLLNRFLLKASRFFL